MLKIGAPPVVLPIAVAGRLRPLRATDFARLWCRRLRRFRRRAGGGRDGFARFFFHQTNMGGNSTGSTGAPALKRRVFSV
jgi:hypothetical protein